MGLLLAFTWDDGRPRVSKGATGGGREDSDPKRAHSFPWMLQPPRLKGGRGGTTHTPKPE